MATSGGPTTKASQESSGISALPARLLRHLFWSAGCARCQEVFGAEPEYLVVLVLSARQSSATCRAAAAQNYRTEAWWGGNQPRGWVEGQESSLLLSHLQNSSLFQTSAPFVKINVTSCKAWRRMRSPRNWILKRSPWQTERFKLYFRRNKGLKQRKTK